MNICGVLVHVNPRNFEAVEAALMEIPGVEIHQRADEARLIATVEDTPETSAADGLAAINGVSGVIAAALVYHYGEADSEAALRSTEE